MPGIPTHFLHPVPGRSADVAEGGGMFTPEPHDIRHPPEDAALPGTRPLDWHPQGGRHTRPTQRHPGCLLAGAERGGAGGVQVVRVSAVIRCRRQAHTRRRSHGPYVRESRSGSTEIRIEKYGTERVLAIRGPGQLVGERAALQISVRSASVVAVDTVHALVARIRDFAAFISDHPRVLDIIERQTHDRYGADALGSGPGGPVTTGLARTAAGAARENCTVMLSDVAGSVPTGATTKTAASSGKRSSA